MLRESEVLSLLMRRTPAHSLEQDLYCDAGVFEVDMEKIWYREWVFAIPACEIPKAGEFVVHEIGAYSVVIVRGNGGEIRAFHNACRHRGSVLCKTKKGRGPKLVCPYHQWTYELDGSLLWARDMGPDFVASDHGLMSVHCRNVSGMVELTRKNEPGVIHGIGRGMGVCDNDRRAHMGHREEQPREFQREPHATMRRRISGKVSCVQGNAVPGKPIHVRHRCIVGRGPVITVLLEHNECTGWRLMSGFARAAGRDGDPQAVAVDMHSLLIQRNNDRYGSIRLAFGVPREFSRREIAHFLVDLLAQRNRCSDHTFAA